MRRVISLFLPNWPTDRLRRQEGCGSPDRPLVTATRQGARRVIMAVDPKAAGLGLRPGMAVSQAQAMLDFDIAEADPAGDAAALQRLAAWCLRRFSPLASPCAPDGIWIDITGGAHLFGGEARLLAAIVAQLAEAGIGAQAAIADTPGAAHALARHSRKPVTILPPGEIARALVGLPIAALRLPPEMVEGLSRLGFDTIAQVMQAPRAPMSRRFGGAVLRRLDQALGAVPEPIEPMLAPDLPRARQGFPDPIATPEDLARATALLAARLCEKLEQRGLGACRLDLVFSRVDGVALAVRVGTHQAGRDAAHLTRLLTAQIEKIDVGFGIEAMCLAASMTDRLGARQIASVFGDTPPADLSALIDTLQNRIGETGVHRRQPVESDIPERCEAWVAPMAAAAGKSWPAHWPRPARLLEPPRQIEAVALLPDHAPVRFIWRRQPHRILRADGPERIFGEWWKHAGETFAVRDYFQVEDEVGQRFWLFRNGDGQNPKTGDLRWFLHGMFG